LLVAGNQIGHKGFAHADAGMQAVEGVGHSAATRSCHVGFEAQDFKAQPVGFAAGEDVGCATLPRRRPWGAGRTRQDDQTRDDKNRACTFMSTS
jgi:hypothetical protein